MGFFLKRPPIAAHSQSHFKPWSCFPEVSPIAAGSYTATLATGIISLTVFPLKLTLTSQFCQNDLFHANNPIAAHYSPLLHRCFGRWVNNQRPSQLSSLQPTLTSQFWPGGIIPQKSPPLWSPLLHRSVARGNFTRILSLKVLLLKSSHLKELIFQVSPLQPTLASPLRPGGNSLKVF